MPNHLLTHKDENSDVIGRSFVVPDANDGNEEGVDDLDSATLYGITGTKPLTFQPMYALSACKDPTSKDQLVSMANLLPTRIGENPSDLKLSVEDNKIFKIKIKWPPATVAVPQLMQGWFCNQEEPEMKSHHPEVQEFYSFLENFQSRKVTLSLILPWRTPSRRILERRQNTVRGHRSFGY